MEGKCKEFFYSYVSLHTNWRKVQRIFLSLCEFTHKLEKSAKNFFIPMWAHIQLEKKCNTFFILMWVYAQIGERFKEFFIHMWGWYTFGRKVKEFFYPNVSSHTIGRKVQRILLSLCELIHNCKKSAKNFFIHMWVFTQLGEKCKEFFVPEWAHTQIGEKCKEFFIPRLTLLYVNFQCYFNSLGSKEKTPLASGFFFLINI